MHPKVAKESLYVSFPIARDCADAADCKDDAGKQYIFGSVSGKGKTVVSRI